MANLKSSKKDIRRIARRTANRKPFLRNAKMFAKKVRKLVAEGKINEAKDFLPLAFKAVDKAARKNIYHKNKASRIKSRLHAAIAKAEAK